MEILFSCLSHAFILCLSLSKHGNHVVTADLRVPSLSLSFSFTGFLSFSFPPYMFTFYVLSFTSVLFCSLCACLFLTIFLHLSFLPLFLTCSPPPSLSFPFSAQSSGGQLAWFSSGVVKYKYNKDVFELVNPFWAEKHHHRAHRCGTYSGERVRDGEREEGQIPHLTLRIQQQH